MITHIVLMRFREQRDAEEARDRLRALSGAVPQIRSLAVGLDVGRTQASFDLALTTTHDDLAGLRGYQEHSAHVEVLDWLRPRLTDRTVVDYES